MLLILTYGLLTGQEYGKLKGSVRDSVGDPVELANIALLGTQEGTMTSTDGTFDLEVPAGRSYTVVVSCIGYRTFQFAIRLQPGETQERSIALHRDVRSIKEVSVSARQEISLARIREANSGMDMKAISDSQVGFEMLDVSTRVY